MTTAFCPFFSTPCPESNVPPEGCYIWTEFGCCIIDKPGKRAMYTSPPQDPVDVFILEIFSSNAKVSGDILIVYALASDGSIHLEDDITKFMVHLR